MNIEIKGLDSLFSKLEKLPGSIEASAVKGMNKTLQDMTADAKENCTVDTGQLRDSIEPYSKAHEAKSDGKAVSGAFGTDCEHGPYVEFGTGPHGEETPVSDKYPGPVSYAQKGWTYFDEKTQQFVHTRGQPAQPFLWPAYQAHKDELPENIKKAADEEVKKLTK